MIVGKIYFLLVRIKIKYMELAIIRRETTTAPGGTCTAAAASFFERPGEATHTHTHSHTPSLTHSHTLTHSLLHTLLHSLTHSHTHSHTHTLSFFVRVTLATWESVRACGRARRSVTLHGEPDHHQVRDHGRRPSERCASACTRAYLCVRTYTCVCTDTSVC